MDHITPPYEIARWIAAYLSKSLGSDEQMQLDRWRKASPAHEALFQKLCNEQRLLRYGEQRSWFNEAEGWQRLQEPLQRFKFQNKSAIILTHNAQGNPDKKHSESQID